MNLPDFKNLEDEQKKLVFLVVLLAVGGLYALFSFGLGPLLQKSKQASMELSSLRDKLDRGQALIGREDLLRTQLVEAQITVGKAANNHIPPVANPLSWVAERMYGSARKVGLDIESVSGLGTQNTPWSKDEEEGGRRAFIPYTVRVVLQCSYRDFLNLVKTMEEENPYLNISEVVIASQDGDAENHRVSFSVQWPFWADPEEGAGYRVSSQETQPEPAEANDA